MWDCNEPFSGQHGSEGQTHVCDRAHRVSERYLTSGADRDNDPGRESNVSPGQPPHSLYSQQTAYMFNYFLYWVSWLILISVLFVHFWRNSSAAGSSELRLDWKAFVFLHDSLFQNAKNQVRKCSLWCDVLSGVPATVTPCFYPPCLFFWCDSSQLYLFSSSRCLSCVSLSKFCVNVYVQWLTTLGGLTVCHLLFSLSFFLSLHISFSILASAWHSRPLGLPGHWDFSRCSWWPLQACLTCFHPLP